MIYILILIIIILLFLFYKKKEHYDNIFGDQTEFDLSCYNNNIQRHVNTNPMTTISPCNEKNLLTAENYFRTTYMNLPLFHYNNVIEPSNF